MAYTTKLIFLWLWSLEVSDEGVVGAGSSWDLSRWSADGCLLPVSSHGHPSLCVCVLISYSYKDTHPIGLEATLMTSF